MSFLTPLFWLGLAATAIPIIVHLVRRTRAPRVDFPSLMFVRKIPQQTIRRRRLQNLLLLILRCFALMLLVFAFVRPFIKTGQAGGDAKRGVEVILLDRSLSMRYEGRFERARIRAQRLIDERSTSRLALVLFDEGYEVVVPPTDDRAQLKSRLAEVAPGFGATDLDQALRGVESLLLRLPGDGKTIHLLTDFQATSRKVGEPPYRAAAGIAIVPFNVGRPDGANIATTEVVGTSTIFQPKYSDPLTARVSNFSSVRADARIEFRLNDRPVEKREISIPARESRTVEFSGFNLNEGINRGTIIVAGDDFDADNRSEFLLRRTARSKALVIETATGGGGRGESFYLQSALTAGANNPFELEVRSPGRVGTTELREQRLIILNDVGLNPGLATEVINRVEGGTGLIVALGPHNDSAVFEAGFKAKLGISPGSVVERRGDGLMFGGVSGEHPIFEPFRQAGRLPTARVRAYRQIEPAVGATVLARYDDGAPALIESTLGRGRVLILTTTLDLTWSDLPLTPFYLPLLRQMARHLLGTEPALAATVGESVAIDATPEGELPTIDSPSEKRLPPPVSGSTGAVITVTEPGLYRLRYPDRTSQIAVNIGGRESDLAGLDSGQVMAEMTGQDPVKSAERSSQAAFITESDANEGPNAIEARQRLWFYLLIAALLLFITEGLIARRIRAAKLIN